MWSDQKSEFVKTLKSCSVLALSLNSSRDKTPHGHHSTAQKLLRGRKFHDFASRVIIGGKSHHPNFVPVHFYL